ncbi:RrF2 family transcriptional regulator [Terrimonas pollutisoli]|uniref:RrF2 family transcriptional regulator n=1 Tax=Terrimonas pollutisoli TaxID=3034147 RepID=UPI0023ED0975|nr:Rrf2 family transcriptional regulator [Terrimonas sp. H1YJ31]
MLFSKSFGYALRGILYIAVLSDNKKRVQVDEVAMQLVVPKHFLSKIMKKIVKKKILNSTKGPYGGLSINEKTLSTSLIELFMITDESTQLNKCLLGLKECNPSRPCPLHHKMANHKKELVKLLSNTTVRDLLEQNRPGFVKSLSEL